ncbi:MAG: sugar transferase [Clostridia bacterium]
MYKFVKRFFDIFLSGLALILLWPVMLVTAIVVRIKLKGKAIFSQYRPGRKNKIFKLYKFRSMSNERDKDGNLLPDEVRLTSFGKKLRKTSLDELPQLWNIFKGDMSIIGPRPRIMQECVFLPDEDLQIRLSVRPGLTGWAQVNGRNNITFDQVVEYDKEYVKKLSFGMDFKIFFMTIGKVFKSADVNKNGTASNEFYGDMLLRTNKISKEEYNAKQNQAKELIDKAI